jgi:hypothetical protein
MSVVLEIAMLNPKETLYYAVRDLRTYEEVGVESTHEPPIATSIPILTGLP